jgi:hypothetical protein
MLERLIEDTKVGDFVLDLHPSANLLFEENGALETVCLTPYKKLDEKVTDILKNENSQYKQAAWKTLNGTVSALNQLGYAGLETTCRLSESAVRGTGKLANLGYQKAADQWTQVEDFSQKVVNQYKHLKRKIPQSVKNFLQRIKDPLVVGASVALMALSYGGLKGCSEEPEAEIETVDYQNPTDSIANLFVVPDQENVEPENPEDYFSIEEVNSRPNSFGRTTPRRTRQRTVRQTRTTPEVSLPQCTNTNSRSEYQSVANAAQSRASSQGNNYAFDNTPTSPLVGLTGNTEPGRTKINWLKNRNKCNQFIGDSLVQAGYKVPTHEMPRNGGLHYKEIEQFPHEDKYFTKVTDFCDIKPGQILVIDHPTSGESTAHGEIIHSVNHQTGTILSFGAHETGAYKKRFDVLKHANFDGILGCWQLGMDNIYVLKPN